MAVCPLASEPGFHLRVLAGRLIASEHFSRGGSRPGNNPTWELLAARPSREVSGNAAAPAGLEIERERKKMV